MKGKSLGRLLDFPLKTFPIDASSAYHRVTMTPWRGQFIRKEFLHKSVIESFEAAVILLIKGLSSNNQTLLKNIIEPKVLLPKLLASLDQTQQLLTTERTKSNSQEDFCQLNNILMYETLLTSYNVRPQLYKPIDFKELSMFSSSALKRKLIINKKDMIKSLLTTRRIVRVHCIFDLNVKMSMKKNNEVMFGSSNLDQNKYEQRIVTFECQDFVWVNKPLIYDRETIESQEVKQVLQSRFRKSEVEIEDDKMNLGNDPFLKKHSRQIIRKKQELKEEDQKDKSTFNYEYLEKQVIPLKDEQIAKILLKSWKIADIDYWLNGNLPYL